MSREEATSPGPRDNHSHPQHRRANLKPTTDNLKDLEARYTALLTWAESLPAGSPERKQATKDADRILSLINDWHERANPTPVA